MSDQALTVNHRRSGNSPISDDPPSALVFASSSPPARNADWLSPQQMRSQVSQRLRSTNLEICQHRRSIYKTNTNSRHSRELQKQPHIKLRVLSRSDESVRNRTAYVSEKMQTRTTNRTRANELLLEYGITAIR